jgi:beta-carotene 3-hydroxylase
MQVLAFLGWIVVGFLGLEVIGYVLHRWIFHGVLWPIHRTHHVAGKHLLEWNDVFSLGFSGLTVTLLILGLRDPLHSIVFPLGLGGTIYGGAYFVIHDVLTHRRFGRWRSKAWLLNVFRKAHLRHHQCTEKLGQEPFGLFFVPMGTHRQSQDHHRPLSRVEFHDKRP